MENEKNPNGLGLPAEVRTILRCPSCRRTLSERKEALLCVSCSRLFPLVNGVVRFVEAESYGSSFGYQWQKYVQTQLDTETARLSAISFRRKTGFTPEELSGNMVLYVGCGMGRYAEVASRWGARVVGIDLSTAAEVAARNLPSRLSVLGIRTLSLALRNPLKLRYYAAYCLKKYDELAGNGLASLSPVTPEANLTITIPAAHTGGGMSFDELVILARVTKSLKPRTIFEIGTYNGLTTAVFILNSEPDARVITLDLPPEAAEAGHQRMHNDRQLVATRQLGSVPQALGLNRYTQLLCDSMCL